MLAVGGAFFALGASEKISSVSRPRLPSWPTDDEVLAWTQAQQWAALAPELAEPLFAAAAELTALGWRPRIYGWRSLERQDAKVAEGTSSVSVSAHNAVDSRGLPASLAADVIDERYGWTGARAEDFFAALGGAAERVGLTWGGRWSPRDPAHVQAGTPTMARATLRRAGLDV